MIEIMPHVIIDERELTFTFTRSPGPGGQNVNKVSTRVTLHFDVNDSPSLTADQKNRVRQKLATRINKEGVLRVISSKERTQVANRCAAVARFVDLLRQSLKRPKIRRKTRVPKAARRKRLDNKTRRGSLKQMRGKRISTDD